MPTEQEDKVKTDAQTANNTAHAGALKDKKESGAEKIAEEIGSAFDQAETGVKGEGGHGHHHHKTPGLKIFDNILFQLTNLSVFAISVWITYKANYSKPKTLPDGTTKDNFLKRRNDNVTKWIAGKFEKLFKMPGGEDGSAYKTAKNLNMVLWSFLDGSAMTPIVAWIEGHRKEVGRWIDERLGTKPKDESVYDDQPKQGWKSVFMGRVAAFLIIIPTFFVLNHKWIGKEANKENKTSLNNLFFDKPAELAVKKNFLGIPNLLSKKFKNLNTEGLIGTGLFETFYTTACTFILFLVSEVTGRKDRDKKEKKAAEEANNSAATQSNSSEPVEHRNQVIMEEDKSWKLPKQQNQPASTTPDNHEHVNAAQLQQRTKQYSQSIQPKEQIPPTSLIERATSESTLASSKT